MTCNVGNNRAKPERLVQVIRESGADIVAMQEVSQEQADPASSELSIEYPYQAMFPGGFAGKAVLSRFPIRETEQLHLSTVRPDLLTRVNIEGKDVSLIVAHPPPPRLHWLGLRFDRQTWGQITQLAEIAVNQPPALLLGDFNLADWWGEYAYLRSKGLKDAFRERGSGRGHTLPKRIGPWKRFLAINRMLSGLKLQPVLRVDYIWYTEPMQCKKAWIGEDTGSDHLPVLAELLL